MLPSIRWAGAALLLLLGTTAHAGTITFDDNALAPNSNWNGPGGAGGQFVDGPFGPIWESTFSSGGATFANRFDANFWAGFVYSNRTDTTTPGYLNQYSAFPGSGHNSANYGVAFGYDDVTPNLFDADPFNPSSLTDLNKLPRFNVPAGQNILSAYITNTTYAALSMLTGDSFAKAFGGASGNDPDWFLLSFYGTDASGNILTNHIDFYLADFRFANNALDYIVSDWTLVNLTALAGATTLYFNVSSSDAGLFGLNSPAYFAIDDIQLADPVVAAEVPEPTSLALWSVLTAIGAMCYRRRMKMVSNY